MNIDSFRTRYINRDQKRLNSSRLVQNSSYLTILCCLELTLRRVLPSIQAQNLRRIRVNIQFLSKSDHHLRYLSKFNFYKEFAVDVSIQTFEASPNWLSLSSLSRIGATLPNIWRRKGFRCRTYNCLHTYSMVLEKTWK